jgi:hypothetical protein
MLVIDPILTVAQLAEVAVKVMLERSPQQQRDRE